MSVRILQSIYTYISWIFAPEIIVFTIIRVKKLTKL